MTEATQTRAEKFHNAIDGVMEIMRQQRTASEQSIADQQSTLEVAKELKTALGQSKAALQSALEIIKGLQAAKAADDKVIRAQDELLANHREIETTLRRQVEIGDEIETIRQRQAEASDGLLVTGNAIATILQAQRSTKSERRALRLLKRTERAVVPSEQIDLLAGAIVALFKGRQTRHKRVQAAIGELLEKNKQPVDPGANA